jgi:hypothetical protein
VIFPNYYSGISAKNHHVHNVSPPVRLSRYTYTSTHTRTHTHTLSLSLSFSLSLSLAHTHTHSQREREREKGEEDTRENTFLPPSFGLKCECGSNCMRRLVALSTICVYKLDILVPEVRYYSTSTAGAAYPPTVPTVRRLLSRPPVLQAAFAACDFGRVPPPGRESSFKIV